MKTMNKLKKLSALTMGLLVLGVSCNDEFLEVPPTGSLADAQVSTQAGIEGLLIGTYAALRGVFGNRFEGPNHWPTGSILGGDANKGTDAGDYSTLNPIQRYETEAVNGDINSLWRGRYEGVSRANRVLLLLSQAADIPAADAARIEGEAKLLRGHFYFDLKKHFNSIVYFDETVPTSEIVTIPNSADGVWDKIEKDFEDAYNLLPATTALGRNNKWAAAAYLAKAKLFQNKFAEAKTWFDLVIAEGVTPAGAKYALLEDYPSIYNAENDQHAEAVFDVESANNSFNVQNSNAFDDLNYPYNTGPDGPGNCCGFFQPSFELANSYRTAGGLPLLDKSYNSPANAVKNDFNIESSAPFTPDAGPLDPRIDHAIGRRGIPYLDWIDHPGKAWIRDQAYGGPYSPKKYIYYRSQENTFTDGSSWTRGYATMNYTIIRYADVLLMAAEAEIGAPGGSLEQARTYVNQVRARAANTVHWVRRADNSFAANYEIALYPPSQFADAASATAAVRFERKLELSGEGHRFFDLVRWGVAAQELNPYLQHEAQFLVTKFGGASFRAGVTEYLPIPQTQIDLQTGVLTQNPGY